MNGRMSIEMSDYDLFVNEISCLIALDNLLSIEIIHYILSCSLKSDSDLLKNVLLFASIKAL